jgi:predicted HTH transcriptional regulator
MDLVAMLRRHEGKTLEFKRDLSSPGPVLRTIVAFANSSGGVLLIGVEDRTRNVIGVAKPLDLQEKLTNVISAGIAPPLMPAIEILPWREACVIAVEVFPSYSRPHYLVKEGRERGVLIRVGPSNRRADLQMQEELGRTARNEAYDELPVPELNSEAIDFRAVSELFASHRKITRKDLKALHLVTRHQKRLVPTNGGIILFGTSRGSYFPDACIQAGRFGGTTRSRILDTREFHDYPAIAVDQAMEFVRKHAQLSYRIQGARRKEVWSVPLPAVREAIINAVTHADYSQQGAPIRLLVFDDRIVVESPGLLPFGLTIDDILRGISKLRNRVVGRVFKELGLIEQWGSGIGRMIDVCREHGLPDPEFEEMGVHFHVTIRLQVQGMARIDEVEARILKAVGESDGLATRHVAEAAAISTRSARSRLKGLVERGLIVEIGSSPTDPKRVYLLADKAEDYTVES